MASASSILSSCNEAFTSSSLRTLFFILIFSSIISLLNKISIGNSPLMTESIELTKFFIDSLLSSRNPSIIPIFALYSTFLVYLVLIILSFSIFLYETMIKLIKSSPPSTSNILSIFASTFCINVFGILHVLI